jgi:NADH-quinone oxidoreductase subunit M
MAIGVINVVYGAFCAMSQTDLKYVIGYSSVSHMGYVILGLAVGGRFGLSGAAFQMFAHGIMTALFFALIGFIYEQTHTRVIADVSGLMKRTPLVAACFVIAGASSMGLPSTAGFVAELLVYVGLVMQSPWLAAAAFIGVVVTAAYVLRLLSHILLGEPSPAVEPIHDAGPLRFAPMALLAFMIMLVGIFPAPLYSMVTGGVMPIVQKLAGG